VKFSRDEQAAAVWLSHTVILVVVTIIMWRSFNEAPAVGFFIGEGVIWVTFLLLVPRYDRVSALVTRWAQKPARKRHSLDEMQQAAFTLAFALTFVLQFVALKFILVQTGGLIESPFAQLAVAFAVFTPILATRVETIVISLIATIGYYWYMLERYGYEHLKTQPGTAVFGAVTTLIVGLTVGLALLQRLDSKQAQN